jgi:hypothetical protein
MEMAAITDPPPAEIAHELSALSSELDRVIPAKLLDRNLLVATWNISNLDGVTEKWISAPEDKPRRDLHAMRIICDILARFDVIAVQKIRHAGQALQIIMQGLGSHWGLLVTTNARGALGFSERLAFIFDTRKVTPRGLAGQLVLSEEDLRRPGKKYLTRQFARPPFVAGFQCLDQRFTLVNFHVFFGGANSPERIPEIETLARWLADWSLKSSDWDKNLIALGQFNLEEDGGPLYQAFTSTGLFVPDDLRRVRSMVAFSPDMPVKFYNQIAWFQHDGGVPGLSLPYLRGGNFDFSEITLQSRGISKRELRLMISDCLPLWAEFSVRRPALRTR